MGHGRNIVSQNEANSFTRIILVKLFVMCRSGVVAIGFDGASPGVVSVLPTVCTGSCHLLIALELTDGTFSPDLFGKYLITPGRNPQNFCDHRSAPSDPRLADVVSGPAGRATRSNRIAG